MPALAVLSSPLPVHLLGLPVGIVVRLELGVLLLNLLPDQVIHSPAHVQALDWQLEAARTQGVVLGGWTRSCDTLAR